MVQIAYATIEQAHVGLRYTDRIRGSVKNSLLQKNDMAIGATSAKAVNDFTVTYSQFLDNKFYDLAFTNPGFPVFNFNQFQSRNFKNVVVFHNNDAAPYSLIYFRYNWWGTDDPAVIESQINDIGDRPAYDEVMIDFSGYRRSPDGNETDPHNNYSALSLRIGYSQQIPILK